MAHIYISNLFQAFLNKKIFRSFWTKNRNRIHHFWDLRDSRTGISAILNRRPARLDDFFSNFFLYQLFGHPMNCNLNQSDEKFDQPGILGLDDPLFKFVSDHFPKSFLDKLIRFKCKICDRIIATQLITFPFVGVYLFMCPFSNNYRMVFYVH